MTCAEIDILLAEYVDGTLHGEQKSVVDQHLRGCPACAALVQDASEAVVFVQRAAEVEAPPELVNKLLFEVSSGASRFARKPSWTRRVFGKWAEPVLQPRFAMGMAMTMLSLAMVVRVLGIPERQLKPADLDPVKLWTATEDRVARVWARGVKYYENLRIVYEIQSRIQEWNEEQPETAAPSATPAPTSGGKQ